MTIPHETTPENERPIRRMADVLGQLTTRLGMPHPDTTRVIFKRWGDVVGPEVAAHAHPRSLRGGVLTVAVDAAAWATELRYLEPKLLARIDEHVGAGTVTELRPVVEIRPR